jgi:uncharacterized protein YegL
MKKDFTEIVCIIDRSGSMISVQNDAIGGFNAFIKAQKKIPGTANATLVLFDHEYEEVYSGKDLNSVDDLNEDTYVPTGMTALMDAVGRTIVTVGERLIKLEEKDKPEKVIICVLTDGYENASKEYSKSKVAEMIQHQQDKYSWKFIFLAANMDAVAEAQSLNIPTQDAFKFNATNKGTRKAFQALSCSVSTHRTSK